ncbi:hypothetical protein [uncultured Bifidobacterium sp.]|uniref:hypothetical protein n=1 Tax=uncultured Bifidobacterium sp. TaxID=165187 RepID=UPI0028DD2330|nr:hypothetical protein [uncultured Bifidobacterium sp.]
MTSGQPVVSEKSGRSPMRRTDSLAMVSVVIVQFLAFLVLLVCGATAGTVIPMAVVAVVALVFLVLWPFRGGVADRVLGAAVGLASLLVAAAAMVSSGTPKSNDLSSLMIVRGWSAVSVWSVVVAVLLVATVVVSFGRQMVRVSRAHLVRSLSHSITSAVALIGAAGWLFLPDLMPWGTGGRKAFLLIVLVVVLVVASVLSCVWWADADPDPAARLPWVGVALLPVLMTGYVVYLLVVLLPVL